MTEQKSQNDLISELNNLKNHTKSTDYMKNFVNALNNAGVKVQEHVATIFDKLAGKQSAYYMVDFVNALNNAGVKLTEDRVATIFDKLAGEQCAWQMADVVNALSNAGVKLTEDRVATILNKLDGEQGALQTADFVNALSKAGVKLTEDRVATILNKLDSKQSAWKCVSYMADLVNALNKAGVKLTEDCVATILKKLNNDDNDIVGNIKLATALKNNDKNLQLPDNLAGFWDESLLLNEQEENQNINISGKDNIIIKNENYSNNNNEGNDSKSKKLFAKEVMKYFEKRSTQLKSNYIDVDINNEKSVWKQVARGLQREKLLDKKQVAEFSNKIDNIDNLSGFITFIRWLGSVLSVPFSLGFSRRIDCINSCLTFSRTKNTRISERLRDTIIPLQEIAKGENQIEG